MTKFAVYVAQFLLCESCKFGEKIFYSNCDNEFFLRDCFLLAHPVYISRLCYDVSVRLSVRLSVTDVHWHIIANLGFKFRSHFTAHCGRCAAAAAVLLAGAVLLAVLLAGESSRAMLASARLSCFALCGGIYMTFALLLCTAHWLILVAVCRSLPQHAAFINMLSHDAMQYNARQRAARRRTHMHCEL